MQYLISMLEGIITFISPCLLPMLPIYVSYFMGGQTIERKYNALRNSLGFVIGFTIVFISLGAFAGTLGQLLTQYRSWINIVTGGIVILFGLNYLGILTIRFLNNTRTADHRVGNIGFWSSILMGLIFSIGWTPCVGAFLGSALMLASQQGSAVQGILMLLAYSVGLGIPFVISALLIDKMKGTFDFIKRHYIVVNRISGVFLIIIGLLMMTGYMGYFLSLLTF